MASGLRVRYCPTCGDRFDYKISRGRDRIYCGKQQCSKKRCKQQTAKRFASTYIICSTQDCGAVAVRRGHGLCEACYYQLRRTGSVDRMPVKTVIYGTAGYLRLLAPGHPLAQRDHRVLEHRKVLYDSLGPGPHPCYWCGAMLTWHQRPRCDDAIVVDHLNEVKTDNRFENLVISCNRCNRARGSAAVILSRISPDRFEQLIDSLRAAWDCRSLAMSKVHNEHQEKDAP